MSNILIIDDNQVNREFLVTLLGYDGHILAEAKDGEDGFTKTLAQRPDLVIADILMPNTDGFEYARRVRLDAAVAATPIIFATAAFYEGEARSLASEVGVDRVLIKPIDPRHILEMVRDVLGMPPEVPTRAPSEEFDRQHMRLLTDKLSQNVLALEIINRKLTSLIAVAQGLAAEHDPQTLLVEFSREACRIVGASFGLVVVSHLDGDRKARWSYFGSQPSSMDFASIGEGFPEAMARAGSLRRSFRAHLAPSESVPAYLPPILAHTAAVLGVEVASPAQHYGWFLAGSGAGGVEFSDEDERIASALARQVGVNYENALLLDQIQGHATELEGKVRDRTAELQRSNEELEQFAYVAAHDLQEPLRKIIGYEALLTKRYRDQLQGDAAEFLGYISSAARRMSALIEDLLSYSRISSRGKELVLVEAGDVLRDALVDLASAQEESGAVVTWDTLPAVYADGRQIQQLFQNLVGNCIKFRGPAVPKIHVGARREDDGWTFSVQDNGIGIDPQFADRIFRVFQRLHTQAEYPGTGIGLAICKKIVERHGGRIWVTSEPGEGATFVFTLPDRVAAREPEETG